MSSTPSATNTCKTQSASARESKLPTNVESLLREAFDDVALFIGGAASRYLDDALTWTLMERLDRIRVRLLRELRKLPRKDLFRPGSELPPRVHPAVEAFLIRNQPEMGE
ncbi:MAG: hypothetical protein LC114_12705 [Bryobacterales bacterium]|nr:hypothetical protein [Bryobacterales bacterium]